MYINICIENVGMSPMKISGGIVLMPNIRIYSKLKRDSSKSSAIICINSHEYKWGWFQGIKGLGPCPCAWASYSSYKVEELNLNQEYWCWNSKTRRAKRDLSLKIVWLGAKTKRKIRRDLGHRWGSSHDHRITLEPWTLEFVSNTHYRMLGYNS